MKRIRIYTCVLVLMLLLMTQKSAAQSERTHHSINVWGLGGYAAMLDNMDNTQNKLGYGGGVGVGYEWISHHFMLGVGVEGVYAFNENTLNDFNNEETRMDRNNDVVTYRYLYSDYVEKKTLINAELPIYVGVHTTRYFYALAGCKVGLVLKTDYSTAAQMFTEGEYARFIEPFRSVPSYGYYDVASYNGNGLLSLGLNLIGTLEAGADIPMKGNKTDIRIGVFCDYGISNLNTKEQLPLIDYAAVDANPHTLSQENLAQNIKFNSLLSSDRADGKRFNTLLVGLKLCFKFKIIEKSPCHCDY